ncbi:MAG: subtilisin family serine protease [Planctomycetota bacterium]|jgi:subtilisin family serine protease
MIRLQIPSRSGGAFLAACALASFGCRAERHATLGPIDQSAASVPGSLIVKFRPGVRVMADTFGIGIDATPIAPDLVPNLYLVEAGPLAGDPERWLGEIGLSDDIEYSHPDYYVYSASQQPTDADFPKQWGLEAKKQVLEDGVQGDFLTTPIADIDAMRGWDVYRGEGKLTVAVVDTGLMIGAIDVQARLWKDATGKVGVDYINGGGVTNDGSYTGHGTRVAMIIGAQPNDAGADSVVGVTHNCKLMPLRVFNVISISGTSIQSAPVSLVIAALGYAADHGAQVINNSYGAHQISDAAGLHDAIDGLRLGGNDCLFVCAAGNTGADLAINPFYPASFDLPHMITVTSTDSNDQIPPTGRNHGVGVDLAAPGENIYAGAKYNYGYASGTSFSTAFVSGAAALVWEYRPKWTAAEVKQCILDSVRSAPQFTGLVESGGVLNLGNLMELAQKYPFGAP